MLTALLLIASQTLNWLPPLQRLNPECVMMVEELHSWECVYKSRCLCSLCCTTVLWTKKTCPAGNAWKAVTCSDSMCFILSLTNTSVYLQCNFEQQHSKVNTFEMPALHEETSRTVKNVTPTLWASCPPPCTQTLILSLSCQWFYWRDNHICSWGRLRQARIATNTEVWIYVSQMEEYTWQGSGILWH